jgi:hypothetical protein
MHTHIYTHMQHTCIHYTHTHTHTNTQNTAPRDSYTHTHKHTHAYTILIHAHTQTHKTQHQADQKHNVGKMLSDASKYANQAESSLKKSQVPKPQTLDPKP